MSQGDEKNLTSGKSEYFSIGDAWEDLVSFSSTKTEKGTAVAKLIGKSLFNVGKFTVKEIIPGMTKAMLEQYSKQGNEVLKRDDLSSEKRKEVEAMVRKADEQLEQYKK